MKLEDLFKRGVAENYCSFEALDSCLTSFCCGESEYYFPWWFKIPLLFRLWLSLALLVLGPLAFAHLYPHHIGSVWSRIMYQHRKPRHNRNTHAGLTFRQILSMSRRVSARYPTSAIFHSRSVKHAATSEGKYYNWCVYIPAGVSEDLKHCGRNMHGYKDMMSLTVSLCVLLKRESNKQTWRERVRL
ncbi:hypothetical protein BDP27DRAFT_1328551, partial [Rhodocollybia butyracea]